MKMQHLKYPSTKIEFKLSICEPKLLAGIDLNNATSVMDTTALEDENSASDLEEHAKEMFHPEVEKDKKREESARFPAAVDVDEMTSAKEERKNQAVPEPLTGKELKKEVKQAEAAPPSKAKKVVFQDKI